MSRTIEHNALRYIPLFVLMNLWNNYSNFNYFFEHLEFQSILLKSMYTNLSILTHYDS